jgi:dipeptidyl aminopeptidase/acylaminoacyl peptidase
VERHRYARRRSQFGELFLPAGGGPFPVAVVLHGGFWKAQYGRRLMHPLCADLAARGWAAWNLEYRRLGRLSGGGWPETFEDVALGIDHLAELPGPRLDLGRVVAIGHSAGGHLAAWAAGRAEPRVPVTGVVSQAGVLDLCAAWERRLSRGVVSRLLDGTPEERPERYEAASPAERLPLGVPALLTHGERDDTVPAEMSESFARRARAAGDEVELVLAPDEGHYGHLDPANELWTAVVRWLPS